MEGLSIQPQSQTVFCVHVGGPWDGLRERRNISGDQALLSIGEKAPEGAAAPWLVHDYKVKVRGSGAALVYSGVRGAQECLF